MRVAHENPETTTMNHSKLCFVMFYITIKFEILIIRPRLGQSCRCKYRDVVMNQWSTVFHF